MTDWVERARRKHQAAERALAARVNQMSLSVPVGDSDYTAPGYLHLGTLWSCIPDPAHPWDPTVLAAIRTILPDAMPLVMRSIWRWSNYNERGHLGPPLVLTHHAIGRAVQDPFFQLHDFACDMPGVAIPGLVIPGRSLSDCVPNYIETIWGEDGVKPWGPDLPNAYLPFDWRLYHRYAVAEQEKLERLNASREVRADGDVVAVGAGSSRVEGVRAELEAKDRSRRDNDRYVNREILTYHTIEPSDVELKEQLVGSGG